MALRTAIVSERSTELIVAQFSHRVLVAHLPWVKADAELPAFSDLQQMLRDINAERRLIWLPIKAGRNVSNAAGGEWGRSGRTWIGAKNIGSDHGSGIFNFRR